jgi:hypothetical protein
MLERETGIEPATLGLGSPAVGQDREEAIEDRATPGLVRFDGPRNFAEQKIRIQ